MTNPVTGSPQFPPPTSATIFINPHASSGRALAMLPRLQKLFEELSFTAQFVTTKTSQELEDRVREAIAGGEKLLLALGGDGTFQGLINAAFGSDVILGVIPAGGGNDFAAALGLPRDPLEAAKAVLRGSPRFVDLVRVRTAEGQTRLYAGGGGVGLDAEAARFASGAFRHFPGRTRYIASALRALAGFVPLDLRLEFPDSDISAQESKAFVAAVLNSPSYGAGLKLAPGATIDDGSLDVVLIQDLEALEILALLPRLMASGELRNSRVKRWQAKQVRITTSKSCIFHGDGEVLGSTPVELEVVPKAISVLAPWPR